MKIEIGQKAPLFTLVDSDKNPVSLEKFRGHNVVLLFYPAAFTGVCTKELCEARDTMGFYNSVDAQVLGISVDLPFTLAKFRQEQNFNFPLLSDFNKETSRAYGAIYEEWILGLKGVSKRATFVIDKEGIVRFAEVLENAGDYPDFAGVKKALEGLS